MNYSSGCFLLNPLAFQLSYQTMRKPWFVLHVRPRCEKKLAEYCQIYSISCYLPLRQKTKIYQRRKVTVNIPVFPGYFFCAFDHEKRHLLLRTKHVLQTITVGNQRMFLHELAQIRKALRVDPELDACAGIRKGHRVKITNGPFMGIEGIVCSVRPNSRVFLNVDMIGQAVPVQVDKAFLEIIPA